MENIKIKKKDNHLLIELKTELFNKNLKNDLKNLKSVKVFNAINVSKKVKISIFPFSQNSLDILKKDVVEKLNQIYN